MIKIVHAIPRYDEPRELKPWETKLAALECVFACEPAQPEALNAFLAAAKRDGLALMPVSCGPGGKNPLQCWTEYQLFRVPGHEGEILDRDFDVEPHRPRSGEAAE